GGLVELAAGIADARGMDAVGTAGRLLCAAFAVARDDLRQPGTLDVAGGVVVATLGAFARLLHLALLAFQLLRGVADVPLGGLLLGAHGLLVGTEVAAVDAQFAALEFGDELHAV